MIHVYVWYAKLKDYRYRLCLRYREISGHEYSSSDDDGAHACVLYASSRYKLNVRHAAVHNIYVLYSAEDASEVLRHNSVIIRRARGRDRPRENDIQMRRKSIPRWNRRGFD